MLSRALNGSFVIRVSGDNFVISAKSETGFRHIKVAINMILNFSDKINNTLNKYIHISLTRLQRENGRLPQMMRFIRYKTS